MRRTTDVELVNRLCGADFSDFFAEPLHVCLIEGESVCFFAWRGPGIYEIHIGFATKGRAALDLFRAFTNSMIDMWGARLFWGLIPLPDRRARMFTRLAGCRAVETLETRNGPCELFVLENV